MVKSTKNVNKAKASGLKKNTRRKMTKKEAGQRGGLAKHICRGRGCHEE